MVELADVTKEQVGELVTDDEVALDAGGGCGVHDVVAVRADHLEAPQWARPHVGRREVDRAPSVHRHSIDEAVDRTVRGHQGPDQPEDACGLLQVRRDHWVLPSLHEEATGPVEQTRGGDVTGADG